MAIACGEFSKSQAGPYNQHLVLGASLTSMTLNAGWGSTSSSCSLGLVYDGCSHWRDEATYGTFNTARDSVLQQPNNYRPKDALNKSPVGPRVSFGEDTAPEVVPTGFTNSDDPYNGLTRVIGQADQNKENYQKQNDIDDLGKVVWAPQPGGFLRKNWLGPDPGFIADQGNQLDANGLPLNGFDVNGTCVFARFDELFFGGFIKSWDGKSGSSGSTYNVSLQSMTPILNGFNMILNEYTGSVGTRYNTGNASLPIATIPSSNYIGDYNGTYFGSVRGGNHPNLVNLYGIATAFYGFTASQWRTDRGVAASDIYFLIRALLDPTNTYIPHSAWFPYGAIIGRSLIDRTTGLMVDTAETAFTYRDVSLSYNDLGWMPAKLAIDNRFRPMFALDLSSVPMPPNDLIISESNLTLTGFLDLLSKGGNYDYQIDCLPSTNPLYSAIIKVNTVDRSVTAPIHTLKNSLLSTPVVENVSYGEEFNPSSVRKVIIGGPQQRVIQMTTASKNVYQEVRAYDPYAVQDRTLTPHSTQLTSARQASMNAATLPTANTRWYKSFIYNGALVAQSQTTTQFFSVDSNGLQAVKAFGNYGGRISVAMPNYDSVKHSYPLSSDLISPYYGIDSRGITRPVYFDKYMAHIQILTSMSDWNLFANYAIPPGLLSSVPENTGTGKTVIPPASTDDSNDPPDIPNPDNDEPTPLQFSPLSSWIISETDIRAAKSGLEQFVAYLYNEYENGFRGFTAVLFFNYIQFNFGVKTAKKLLAGQESRDKMFNTQLTDLGDLNSAKLEHTLTNATKDTTGNLSDYRIKIELEALRKFLAEEVGSHHAKEYAIRLPEVYSYVDRENNVQFSYVPVDAGWEEEGSPLDDTMVFGGTFANYLANENGTMPPILGFNASLEYDRQSKKITDDDVTAMPPEPLEPSPTPQDPDGPDDNPEEAEIPKTPPTEENGGGSGGSNAPPDEANIPGNSNTAATGGNTLTETPMDLGVSPIRSENSRGWYCPLDTEKLKGSDGALYLTSAGQMRATRQNFYASIGFNIPAGFATYDLNSDSHLQRRRNLACIRKVYVKGQIKDISPRRRGEGKKFGYNMMHGSSPMCVINGPSQVEQKAEKSVLMTILIQKFLFNFLGFQVPKESGYPRPWQYAKMIVQNGQEWTRGQAANEMEKQAKLRNTIINGNVTESNKDTTAAKLEFNTGMCAIPNFAAIPFKSNVQNYGPWSSVPGLVENILFNNPNVGTIEPLNQTMADNMVGGIEVDYQESAVPWNFGGIEYLDYAKLTLASAALKGQQGLEKGSFSVPGILLSDGAPVSIGGLVGNSGPVVNSINVSINGNGGVKTNYTLRTWTNKVGFYNESRASEIAEFGKRGNQIRQQNADLQVAVASIPTQVLNAVDRAMVAKSEEKPKVDKTSPVEALVGSASPYVRDGCEIAAQATYGPGWSQRPSTASAQSGPDDTYQHIARTTLYDKGEFCAKEIQAETYNYQSMMSLDGIVSPISFYPTPYGSTFSITKYDRAHCPYCQGGGTYSFNVREPQRNNEDFPSLDAIPVTNKNEKCQFCIPSSEKQKEREQGADLSVTIRQPPYIVDYGPDSEISNEGDGCEDTKTLINYTTLTPVVMSSSSGEFAVAANRQNGDLCAHSIRMVGIGWLPPEQEEDVFLDTAQNRAKNYSDYDNSFVSNNSSNTNVIGNGEEEGASDQDFKASNNARFMGLRGPLMLHSWGYDLDGYPVPNASGDLKYDSAGNILLDGGGNPVYGNQKLLSDGTYSAPFATQEFAKNWASAPNTWPVGPIDLRWNAAAKVWTVGVEYSDVYVVLENDLNGTDPVRAILKDAADHSDPLPDGFRKLVFVQDPNGTFSAPRGTTLYSKYNVDTGYYNPIYNTTTFTSGIVIGNGAATVIVSEAEYDVGYENPLNINIAAGNPAIFMFINGQWVIQSTSC